MPVWTPELLHAMRHAGDERADEALRTATAAHGDVARISQVFRSFAADEAELPADALVISTHALGYAGVDAFNELTTNPAYSEVPGVLVAGETQANVAGHVRLDRIRRFVQLPIHTDEMTRLLEELIPARA